MAHKKVKLAIIDAHALIYRAYYALPPMSTKDGMPTNAVYGFTSMLLKMFSTLKPTHVVAAFDMRGPTFRSEVYAGYKANRKKPPKDLVEQFDVVREVLRAFGIPVIQKKGFEADDIIGTLVETINDDVQKVIVTGDMDTLQLVDDDTSVFTLKRGISDTVLYDEEKVVAKFGFGPEHVVDFKGLRGDPSDNIPGVEGIGEKTAKDLVCAYGSIERVYEHIQDVSARARTRLDGHKKDALFCKMLATIRLDVPISFTLDDSQMKGYDMQAAYDMLQRLEFHSLLKRLPSGGKRIQPSLFQSGEVAVLPKHYHIVKNESDVMELKGVLRKSVIVAFDTETDGLGARVHPIIGMSFAIRLGAHIEAWYVPVDQYSVKDWKDILENSGIKKTGHNLKYDCEVLLQSDIEFQGIVFDSMIASYLLNPGTRQYGLDELASSELGHHTIQLSDLIGNGKEQKRVSDVPLVDLARYACEDADVSLQLYEKLSVKIKQEGLDRVLDEIEIPLIYVLACVELNGVALDASVLNELNTKIVSRLSSLQKRIWKYAEKEFNINSTQQLRVVLFETLALPTHGIKRTQTGYSTAASELEKLHDAHPVIALLEEYRELSKLKNTYVDALPKLVDSATGRIYTSFNQAVTATGRLSSSDPNLQNIPIRTDIGQEVRRAFVAEKGMQLVKADYSQLELRIAAHLSRDVKLKDAFAAGEDIHSSTAAWVFGIDVKDVTDVQRRQAKTLNFGVLYGMGPKRFAREASVSMEEAQSFIGRYHDQYSGVTAMIDETVACAASQGYVETLFGRRRYIPEIHSSNPVMQSQAERMAFNFPIQGTGADIIKKAMNDLHRVIVRDFTKARMVLTVHDELVCEVPIAQVEKFADVIKNVMEHAVSLDVPVIVDVGVGANWKDAQG